MTFLSMYFPLRKFQFHQSNLGRLNTQQQAKKKQQMPRFRELRQEGKIAYFRGDKLFVRDPTGAQPRLVAVVRN